MNLTFEQLVTKSGDSFLRTYLYSSGKLSVTIDMDELNIDLTIQFFTNKVTGIQLPESEHSHLRTCRIEVVSLSQDLHIQNGYYIPASDFAGMMQQVRKGTSLAYGCKASDVKWLVSFVGYSRLVSCLIANISHITWVVHEQ